MFTSEFLLRIQPLLDEIAEPGHAYDRLRQIAESHAILKRPLTDLLQSTEPNLSPSRAAFFKVLNEIDNQLKTPGIKRFHRDLEHIAEHLSDIRNSLDLIPAPSIDNLLSLQHVFEATFEEWLYTHTPLTTLPMLEVGNEFYKALFGFVSALTVVRDALTVTPPPDSELLTIDLDGDGGIDDIISLLSGIAALYDHLCRILDIEKAEFPLNIARIESGSWQLVLKGSKLVCDGLKFVLTFARPFTRFGKLQTADAYVGTLAQYPKLLEHLHKQGQDIEAHNKILTDLVAAGLDEMRHLAPRIRTVNHSPLDTEVRAYLRLLEQESGPPRLIEGPPKEPDGESTAADNPTPPDTA